MDTHICPSAPPSKGTGPARRKHQAGVSLLEVLIAVLVMSFGVTGVALLMAATIQYNKTTQYQIIALQIATQLAESMRGNTQGFLADAYAKTDTYSSTRALTQAPQCTNAAECTAAEIAAIDQAQAANTLRTELPGGDFNVLRHGKQADIWIMWTEPGSAGAMAFGTANCRPQAIGAEQPRCLYLRASL